MDTLRDEFEQAQLVKQWIRTYGPSIAGGVGLGLAVLFGWNAWQDYRHERASNAAQQYAVLVDSLESDTGDATALAAGLLVDFSDTPYAFNAALILARLETEAGNLEAAEKQLRWAMAHPRPPEMAHVARLRLARLMIAQDRLDAAMQLIDDVDPRQFGASYAELRGDIHAERGELEAAREAYKEALDTLTPGTGNRSILQMKFDNIAPRASSPGDADVADAAEAEQQ